MTALTDDQRAKIASGEYVAIKGLDGPTGASSRS